MTITNQENDEAEVAVDAPAENESEAFLTRQIAAAMAAMQEEPASSSSDESSEALNDESAGPIGFSDRYRGKLAILRAILDLNDPVIEPTLNPHAPKGHSWQPVEQGLRLEPGRGEDALDELADLGLLRRELHNLVHLCGRCHHCQLNFRETCPTCDSFDLQIECLIHHFRCAYTGLESEYKHGLNLVCPKCRRELHQLGQDFERPNDTYACRTCEKLFEEPKIQCQCLNCEHECPGTQVDIARIYRYRPTPLAVRAVELSRLTGLDAADIMMDSNLNLATREFLGIEVQREIYRMNRYGGHLSVAMVRLMDESGPCPIFRDWGSSALRRLADLLIGSLRSLDIIARLDKSGIGFLFPETDVPGCLVVRNRLLSELESLQLKGSGQKPLRPHWVDKTWVDGGASAEQVMAFFDDPEYTT